MNRLDELEAKLRAEAQSWQASPEVEAALLGKLRHAHSMRVIPIRAAAALAIAATLLVAFLWPKPKPASPPKPQIARAVEPAPRVRPATTVRPRPRPRKPPAAPEPSFIRIPYTNPLEPYERAEIVRVEMPVAALAATGLHIQTADTSAKAQADLLVGQDGMARAIRLIAIRNDE